MSRWKEQIIIVRGVRGNQRSFYGHVCTLSSLLHSTHILMGVMVNDRLTADDHAIISWPLTVPSCHRPTSVVRSTDSVLRLHDVIRTTITVTKMICQLYNSYRTNCSGFCKDLLTIKTLFDELDNFFITVARPVLRKTSRLNGKDQNLNLVKI